MGLLNKKKEELKVEFWTSVPGLSKIQDLTPKKQSSMLPEWWKNSKYDEKSIKRCPSFPQVFSTSYVIPMWCDTEFTRRGNEILWRTPANSFTWTFHTNDQFLDNAPDHVKNKFSIVAKAICPWRIKTPKGYSMYQLPAYWHFNKNFTLVPGIIDTDYYHEVNQQVLLSLEDGESFILQRGEPLAIYFPFKREKFDLEVREQNQEDFANSCASNLIAASKFTNGYRNYQKFMEREN